MIRKISWNHQKAVEIDKPNDLLNYAKTHLHRINTLHHVLNRPKLLDNTDTSSNWTHARGVRAGIDVSAVVETCSMAGESGRSGRVNEGMRMGRKFGGGSREAAALHLHEKVRDLGAPLRRPHLIFPPIFVLDLRSLASPFSISPPVLSASPPVPAATPHYPHPRRLYGEFFTRECWHPLGPPNSLCCCHQDGVTVRASVPVARVMICLDFPCLLHCRVF